jgi:multiple sugar transport system permease protein
VSEISVQGTARAATVARRRRPRRAGPAERRGVKWWLSTIVIVLGAAGMVAPFLWMFATSMRNALHAYDLPPVWFALPSTANYHAAVSGPVPLLHNMANSAIVAVAVTVGQLVFCPLAGYAFARMRFPGSGLVFALLLTSLMVPMQVTIIPLFLLMKDWGLINNLWSLILPGLTGALGVFLMRQFFSTLPGELFEAARLDGAGVLRTYLRIALPLAKPGLTTLAVITFLASWNAYFQPLVFLNDINATTLPPALVVMLGPYKSGNVAVVMAATAIAVLPALVVFLLAQRWIVEALARSGLKG